MPAHIAMHMYLFKCFAEEGRRGGSVWLEAGFTAGFSSITDLAVSDSYRFNFTLDFDINPNYTNRSFVDNETVCFFLKMCVCVCVWLYRKVHCTWMCAIWTVSACVCMVYTCDHICLCMDNHSNHFSLLVCNKQHNSSSILCVHWK